MKEKKKMNIVLYTIIMFVVFFCITELFIWGKGSDIILNAIKYYPKGSFVVSEAVLAALVLIVMLLFKNSYVFTQKREKLTKGLYYGLFYIVGSVIFMLLFGVLYKGFSAGLPVLNLLIGCFFIGVAEEFLCRGWLLNEFLERYGDTKKGIWLSIIISGLIFGLMHLGNIYTAGQDVPTTITQALSAAATGVVFGLIYYKTKNIWSVVIIHGLWDFGLLLGQIAPVTSNTETIASISVVSLVFSLLLVGAELLNLIPYAKDIDAEPKKSSVISFAFVGFGLFLIFTIVSGLISTDFGDEYKYEKIHIDNITISTNYFDDYILNRDNYSFRLYLDNDSNLVLENQNTKHSVILKSELLYDYIIMEEENYFVVAYIDYTDSANPFLKYTYVRYDELSDEDSFLDKFNNRIQKYLLSERSTLLVLKDRDTKKQYVTAYDEDYGYYVLVEDGKVSILEQ